MGKILKTTNNDQKTTRILFSYTQKYNRLLFDQERSAKFWTLKKTFRIIQIPFSVRSCVRDDNQRLASIKNGFQFTKAERNPKVSIHSMTFEHIFPIQIIRKWPARFHHERVRGGLCCHYYHFFYYYYDISVRRITSARRFCWSPLQDPGVSPVTDGVFSPSFYDAIRTRRSSLVVGEGTKRSWGERWRENSIYFYFISENISPLRALYPGVFPPGLAVFRGTVRFTTFVATTRYWRNRLKSTA